MKKHLLLSILALIFLPQVVHAQKVKYKDLFILLNSKKYEEAEPFLRIFVGDPKNSDHANAHFHMALMLEYKANRNDILTQNELLVNNIDSAIYYFGIAKGMIDEREIKKNDEYYQSYSRRDLRTGDFGIKLSDIHFDIENRVKALNDQRRSISKLYDHFVKTEIAYSAADSIFQLLQKKFSNQNSLLLKANDPALSQLGLLTTKFDSTRYHFNEYKSYLEKFPESKYNQKISLVETKNLEEVAVMPTDWKKDEIKVRNYRDWATNSQTLINGEIAKMKDHLVTYNKQLDNLTSKTIADSTSARNELTNLVDQMLADDLRKYDDNPLPLAVFNYKVKRIEYFNLLFQEDSIGDYDEWIPVLNNRVKLAKETSTLANAIGGFDLEEESEKYSGFVESIGGKNTISTLMVNGKQEMEKETIKWMDKEKEILERMKWGISESDSISLVPSEIQAHKYHSLLVKDSIPELKAIVSGIVNTDSRQAFTAVVNTKYEIENLFTFTMDPFIDSLKMEAIPFSHVMDKENLLLGMYAPKSDTVTRVDINLILNNQLSWTAHLDVPGKFLRVDYDAESDETNVYSRKNEEEELVSTLDPEGKPKGLVKE